MNPMRCLFSCAFAIALAAPPVSSAVLSVPGPWLTDIDVFEIVVVTPDGPLAAGTEGWRKLTDAVANKLKAADLEIRPGPGDPNQIVTKTKAVVSSWIDVVRVPNGNLVAVHAETLVSRAVHSPAPSGRTLGSTPIWIFSKGIEFIPTAQLQAKLTAILGDHMDRFLADRDRSMKMQTREPTPVTKSTERPEGARESPAQTGGSVFVASTKSRVYHRPDCRWARNIAMANRVTYKSPDEATQAGKRPCKTCEP